MADAADLNSHVTASMQRDAAEKIEVALHG